MRSISSRRARELGLQLHVDAEVRTDLVAEHAADAVLFLRREHREPADLVRGLAIREHVDRADAEAEAARLAQVLADDDVPAAARSLRRLLLSLEQRHAAPRGSSPSARSPSHS